MKYARVVLVFAIVATLPAPVHAAQTWWGWLEELSGPGYFQGPVVSFAVPCWLGSTRVRCPELFGRDSTTDRNKRVDRYVRFTVGWLTSNDRPRFKDLPATGSNIEHVIAYPINAAFMFRPHRSIDIGPGAGALLFSGPGVKDHARLILMPVAATWHPFLTTGGSDSRFRRVVAVDLQLYYITKGFNGESFGNSTTTFKSPAETRAMVGLSIDLGEWRAGK